MKGHDDRYVTGDSRDSAGWFGSVGYYSMLLVIVAIVVAIGVLCSKTLTPGTPLATHQNRESPEPQVPDKKGRSQGLKSGFEAIARAEKFTLGLDSGGVVEVTGWWNKARTYAFIRHDGRNDTLLVGFFDKARNGVPGLVPIDLFPASATEITDVSIRVHDGRPEAKFTAGNVKWSFRDTPNQLELKAENPIVIPAPNEPGSSKTSIGRNSASDPPMIEM